VGARAILLSKDLLLKEGTFMAMEVKLLVGDQDFGIPDQGFLLPSTGATTATSSVIGRKRALTQELLTAPSPIISSGITESTTGFNTKKSRGISFETSPSNSVSDSSIQDNLLIENLNKIESQGFSFSNSGNCIHNTKSVRFYAEVLKAGTAVIDILSSGLSLQFKPGQVPNHFYEEDNNNSAKKHSVFFFFF
jgi:hypothetical protein